MVAKGELEDAMSQWECTVENDIRAVERLQSSVRANTRTMIACTIVLLLDSLALATVFIYFSGE